ncbi:hypothetical protein BX616_002839 [Lobosporangium transversale]|uniref:Mitochondrial carrier domain-containing protein n=1 Tax=Lobosporangium transversale TaxID=64571 RepID=A0A1Y2GU69_9FUNG|nr:mitochondrial carrier domain-containing protein [Lobosporangium transversale]KAF9899798.1 hypothetical protein BX616_002839 [Lobosporangium transversale]ORZ23797.1 mitochondrial carrier domain-containing protein [Lobosporangium transversale]|eukprot:XP_021883611.1 mitochondrial carrier domain-containing protein [Lobosporangium transversale]
MPTLSTIPSESFSNTIPLGISALGSVSYSTGSNSSWIPLLTKYDSDLADQITHTPVIRPQPTVVAYAVVEGGESKDNVRESASVGVPTAVARSMLLQGLQFWYRVPIKLFRPMRVDYLVMARAATMGLIPPPQDRLVHAQKVLSNSKGSQFFRATSIGMLTHAIQTQGAGFVYRQVLPPLLLNSFIGSVLYTTYIFTLPIFHPAFTFQKSRTFPPPPFPAVFMAGALAGAAQSLIAAPIDSLKVKFQVQDLAYGGKHKNMASFAITTLKEMGLKTVYRGYALTLIKDSLACGLFFGVFEWVKQQGYYYFIDELYGIREDLDALKAKANADYDALTSNGDNSNVNARDFSSTISLPTTSSTTTTNAANATNATTAIASSAVDASRRPYFLLEPAFVLLAGAAAAVAYQVVDYPMEQIKNIFFAKETELQAEKNRNPQSPHSQHLNSSSMRSGTSISSELYQRTWEECKGQASRVGGWRRFLYSNFATTAIRAVPAASVGFLVFEVMKRKLDARRYESEDREMALYLDKMMMEREKERRAEREAAMEQQRLESEPGYEASRERDYEKQEIAAI